MEEKINTIPSFKANVQDDDGHTYSVHFAALFSANKDAVPILLSHGWPGEHALGPKEFLFVHLLTTV